MYPRSLLLTTVTSLACPFDVIVAACDVTVIPFWHHYHSSVTSLPHLCSVLWVSCVTPFTVRIFSLIVSQSVCHFCWSFIWNTSHVTKWHTKHTNKTSASVESECVQCQDWTRSLIPLRTSGPHSDQQTVCFLFATANTPLAEQWSFSKQHASPISSTYSLIAHAIYYTSGL